MEFLLFDTGSNFGKMYQPMMQPAIGLLKNGKEIDWNKTLRMKF